MQTSRNRWTTYTFIAAFATYWFGNLLLWYPWSYSALLGMTLMFVAITPIWIYSIYDCLKRYHGERLIRGAVYTALIFSFVAIVSDYVFFGIIRDAMTELYHLTTLYGYAFLIALPFVEIYLFKKRLQQKIALKNNDFVKFGLLGVASFLAIIFIIEFNLTLSEGTFKFLTLILASLILFHLVIWIVLGSHDFKGKLKQIILLSILCVIIGMLIGKYGASFGLKWWIYYSIPMLMSVLLPPIILRMNKKQVMVYLLLSFLSAPFMHFIFSFFFNWTEYMPFLEIPYFKTILD